MTNLNEIAKQMVVEGKGILAADESSGTIKKRFDTINVNSSEENRMNYRRILFESSEAMENYISGVILFDETIRQSNNDGERLVDIIKKSGWPPIENKWQSSQVPQATPFTDLSMQKRFRDNLSTIRFFPIPFFP